MLRISGSTSSGPSSTGDAKYDRWAGKNVLVVDASVRFDEFAAQQVHLCATGKTFHRIATSPLAELGAPTFTAYIEGIVNRKDLSGFALVKSALSGVGVVGAKRDMEVCRWEADWLDCTSIRKHLYTEGMQRTLSREVVSARKCGIAALAGAAGNPCFVGQRQLRIGPTELSWRYLIFMHVVVYEVPIERKLCQEYCHGFTDVPVVGSDIGSHRFMVSASALECPSNRRHSCCRFVLCGCGGGSIS